MFDLTTAYGQHAFFTSRDSRSSDSPHPKVLLKAVKDLGLNFPENDSEFDTFKIQIGGKSFDLNSALEYLESHSEMTRLACISYFEEFFEQGNGEVSHILANYSERESTAVDFLALTSIFPVESYQIWLEKSAPEILAYSASRAEPIALNAFIRIVSPQLHISQIEGPVLPPTDNNLTAQVIKDFWEEIRAEVIDDLRNGDSLAKRGPATVM